jgi:hypothetical protein
VVVFAVVIVLLVSHNGANATAAWDLSAGCLTALSFVVGALTSILAGYIGMMVQLCLSNLVNSNITAVNSHITGTKVPDQNQVAVYSNARTTVSAKKEGEVYLFDPLLHYICVRSHDLCVSAYLYICVRIPLYMCLHTSNARTTVSAKKEGEVHLFRMPLYASCIHVVNTCIHVFRMPLYASSYLYIHVFRMPLYASHMYTCVPHASVCVLLTLYMCPHSPMYVSSGGVVRCLQHRLPCWRCHGIFALRAFSDDALQPLPPLPRDLHH